MCPSSGLWGEVLDYDFQFTILSPLSFDGPQFWHSISMCSSLYLLTRAHCARCSPSIPLWLSSHLLAPDGGKMPSPHCVLRIPVSHDRRRACLFFPSCTWSSAKSLFFFPSQGVYMKLFELGVEVAFNNWSAVIHHKVNLLKSPLWSSSFEHIDDAFFAAHLLSAWMSASSFEGFPRCAFTLTRNVAAPAVVLFRSSSIASNKMSASSAPTIVAVPPSPTCLFTAFSSA